MHLLPLSVFSLLVLAFPHVRAAPSLVPTSSSRSIPLLRRGKPHANDPEWALRQKLAVEAKYIGASALTRRASGLNLITNQFGDSSFYGSIAVGTPAVSFNVILDTGSSDLWLAAADGFSADQNGSDVPTFDPTNSTSFEDLDTSFSINYGSGAARGTLGRDVVQMAGFRVQNQVLGVVTQVSQNLLANPVSGLMGLGFQTIATSQAQPFWEVLASSSGTLDEPLMAFQLTRFINDTDRAKEEPGGTFNLGAVNNSLFTGEIDYQPIPDQVGYWTQLLTGLTVNGASINVPSEHSRAAIDTGTTLVAGPEKEIAALYAQIPGSQAMTDDNQGLYTYPCATEVTVSMKFGNSAISWPISSTDFVLQQISSNTCVGGFFALDTNGTSAPPWIVGDVFLKNVYSVFRAGGTPAVGFAQLSETALAMNGVNGPLPSPTVGVVAASVSGGPSGGIGNGNGAGRMALVNASLAVAWAVAMLSGVVGGRLLL